MAGVHITSSSRRCTVLPTARQKGHYIRLKVIVDSIMYTVDFSSFSKYMYVVLHACTKVQGAVLSLESIIMLSFVSLSLTVYIKVNISLYRSNSLGHGSRVCLILLLPQVRNFYDQSFADSGKRMEAQVKQPV